MAQHLNHSARLAELDQLSELKLVRKADHPTHSLAIYNYSSTVQYKKLWNDLLLQCRGLVVDARTGDIVASPMPKFFNYEDDEKELDIGNCDVIEKLDGSLGIYFQFEGKWIMASRGSFVSEQAQEGGSMASKLSLDMRCDPAYTYMFEIIYPRNRIVVDYGPRSELVMIAMVHTATSHDEPFAKVKQEADRLGIVTPRSFPSDSPTALKALDTPNEEGFILRDRTSGHRYKLKFPHYVEIHLVRTRFSMAHVKKWYLESVDWQLDRAKYEYVPDEAFDSVKKEWARFDQIRHVARAELESTLFDCAQLAFRDVPVSPIKWFVCKYLRLSTQGAAREAGEVFDDYIRSRIVQAPESPFEPGKRIESHDQDE